MLGLFGVLNSGLLRPSEINIDNNVCKLHYKVSVVILVAFSILVTGRQYIGDPIECMSSSKVPQNVLDQYCWISSTFTLPHALNKRVGSDVPHPGVGQHRPGEDRVYHQYYQWVCFVLFFQGMLFYVPHYLWKIWEGGRLKALVVGLNSPLACIDPTKKAEKEEYLVRYFNVHLHHHNFYFGRFVICEILNLVNVVGQIYFTDYFLGGEFTSYGSDVVKFTETSQEDRTDPMVRVFPRVTKCIFHTFGHSGDVQKHDALCILPINIVNEKIYVFLWFWFITLAIFTGIAIGYRLFLILFPHAHCFLLRIHSRMIPMSRVNVIIQHAQVGDWFLLHQMSKNMESSTFTDFLYMFGEKLEEQKATLHVRGNGSNNVAGKQNHYSSKKDLMAAQQV